MNKVKDRVSEEEWNLREELSSAYHVFAMLGWTHLIHTHITVKGPREGEFLINAFGLLWEEITPESLVKVDANGAVIDQGSTALGINPAGFKIHSAIHTSERADKWVMHIHVPEVVAVASLREGLIRGLSTYSMDLGPISYHSYEHATTKEADTCARMVSDFGPSNKVLLLRNHGSITVGKTVHEAFFLTYQMVEACRVQLHVLSATKHRDDYITVAQPLIENTYQIVQDNYTGKSFGKLEWEAARRLAESKS